MSALHDLTVAEAARRLRARQLSALELARPLLARSQAPAGLGAFLAQDEAVPCPHLTLPTILTV